MGVYLKLGGVDVSRFITENNYSVSEKPVFDEGASFTNIFGEKIRKRLGRDIVISAVLYDVDNDTAEALEAILSGGDMDVEYSSPEAASMGMSAVKHSLSLDRVYKGEKYWTVEFELCGYVRECL